MMMKFMKLLKNGENDEDKNRLWKGIQNWNFLHCGQKNYILLSYLKCHIVEVKKCLGALRKVREMECPLKEENEEIFRIS